MNHDQMNLNAYALRRRMTPALAGLLSLGLGLGSPAGALTTATAAPAPSTAASASAAPLSADAAGRTAGPATHDESFSFTRMGQRSDIMLKRTHQKHRLHFTLRADELVTQAILRLDLVYSPVLAGQAAVLEIRLNGEVASRVDLPATVPGPRSQTLSLTVPVDARLVSDQNELALQFTEPLVCDDPNSAGQWVQINTTSALALQLAPLPLANELALLPVPFFDRNDQRPAEVTLVLPTQASASTLQAAGSLSSWFGALASYRGTKIRSRDRLPAGHAIVLATTQDRPTGVELPPIAGPTVTLLSHPDSPERKVLYLLGRNAEELRLAVDALVLGQLPGHGSSTLIDRPAPVSPRRLYDAPRWVPTDRPVRFDELASTPSLTATGVRPDPVELGMRLPPDLFPWRQRQIPIDLRLSHTARPDGGAASMKISFNGDVLRDEALNPSRTGQWLDRLRQQVWGSPDQLHTMSVHRPLRLPVAQLGTQSHARLTLAFQHGTEDEMAECRREAGITPPGDTPRTTVDGASTIDFSAAPHYLPMPDLAAFANAGHPYTRRADLADTAVVLPDSPSAEEVDAYLALMSRMGEATGYPARLVAVANTSDVARVADRDLLVIGSSGRQPLLRDWAADMPWRDRTETREPAAASPLPRWQRWLGALWQRHRHPDLEPVSFRGTDAQAALVGFESPLSHGRSVIVLTASAPSALSLATDALAEPKQLSRMHGHVVLLAENGRITSHEADPTYATGELTWLTWLRWNLSDKPILLWLVLMVSIAAMSSVIYVMLRWRAQRRHAGAPV